MSQISPKFVTKKDMPLLEDFADLRSRMNQEGFHYCFKHYSSFKDIDDQEFHKLRKAYLSAAEKLEKYVVDKAEQFYMGADLDFDDEPI
jgi:hypothetical protein